MTADGSAHSANDCMLLPVFITADGAYADPMTIVLDDELLAGFEMQLRRVGAAVVKQWAPGLDDQRIDELLAPLGIDLPEEARAWWRWHNGTLPEAPPIATYIIPSREQMPLEAAANLAETANLMVETFNVPELAKQLHLVTNKPIIYVDCNGPREAPAPIYSQNDDPEPPELALPSMVELITIWTQLIDDGVFATTPDGQWHRPDPDRIPPELRGRGLI
jgi:hypothetical protein